jgi:N-methylhydantoinase B/oxoprolinase/acetone carboxylase alpha subunit
MVFRRRDSAGAGTFRGGLGDVREYEMLADCTLTSRTANHTYTAWGLAGGGYGPASDRDPQMVAEAVRNRYVSLEAAAADYGVIIDPGTLTVTDSTPG